MSSIAPLTFGNQPFKLIYYAFGIYVAYVTFKAYQSQQYNVAILNTIILLVIIGNTLFGSRFLPTRRVYITPTSQQGRIYLAIAFIMLAAFFIFSSLSSR